MKRRKENLSACVCSFFLSRIDKAGSCPVGESIKFKTKHSHSSSRRGDLHSPHLTNCSYRNG